MFQTRIQQIIEHLELSPKEFAEHMGIQRSAISHILNGRNKPSLDFVIKLTDRFPQFNNLWILHGKEPMVTPVTGVTNTPKVSNDSQQDTVVDTSPNQEPIGQKKATGKVASKVLIFYTDGSFEEFKPSH